MEPAPPPITIVDPNALPGAADLLDSGRDPWRPSARQRLAITATVLAVAVAIGAVAQVRHVRHEHALDAAAARDVGFSLDDGGGVMLTDDEPVVTLQSAGRLPVTVLGVTLAWPGYSEVQVSVPLAAYGSTQITLTSAGSCRTQLYTDQPRRLRVRARTSRGDTVTRTLALPDDVADALGRAERFRCGFLRPSDALLAEVSAAAVRGSAVALTIGVRNGGIAPLTLSRLAFLPGVSVAVRLPLTLPPGGPDAQTVPLPVTLRVSDCGLFAASLADPQDRLSPYALVATVSNPYLHDTDPSWIPITSLFQLGNGGGPEDGLNRELARTCPSRLFPKGFLHPPPPPVADATVIPG